MIEVTGDAVLGLHDLLRVEYNAFLLESVHGQAAPNLTIQGRLTVDSDIDGNEVSGVYVASNGDFSQSLFEIDTKGVMSVRAHGQGQAAVGLNAGGFAPAFVNHGLVTVSSDASTAFGVLDADDTFVLTNTGRLSVTGLDAYGVYLFNGGEVVNSGVISATAHGGGAVGVLSLHNATITNSGSIVADHGAGQYAGVGILLGNEEFTTIENAGLIEADYALATTEWIPNGGPAQINFHNTGKVVGILDFGTFSNGRTGFLDDTLRNEGVILGDVFMGSADDLFDGTGGRVAGAVHGDDADDTLTGGGQADRLFGDDANDVLTGAGGSDTLEGGDGYDVAVFSGAQSDYRITQLDDGGYRVTAKHGPDGADIVHGVESLSFSDGSLNIGGPGLIVGTDNPETISGTAGDDVIYGLKGDDTVDGGDGNDAIFARGVVSGGAGDDFVSGAYTVDGGDGIDTVSFAFVGGPLYLASDQGFPVLLNVENLIGGDYNDFLSLGDGNNRLDGAGGDDTLDGGRGDDTLVGGGGLDTASFANAKHAVRVDLSIQGIAQDTGQGMDVLDGIHGLIGSVSNDTLIGGSGDDTICGGGGADHLDGGDGYDMLSFAADFTPVHFSLQAQGVEQMTGVGSDVAVNFEGVIGTRGGDNLIGDDGDNILDGNYGSDVLDGQGGVDVAVIHGSMGSFNIFSVLSGDIVYMVAGQGQSVSLQNIEYLQFDDGLLATSDISHAESIVGGAGADLLVGGLVEDTLQGGAGDDTLRGGLGGDDLLGGDGVDTAVFAGARWLYDIHKVNSVQVDVHGPDGGDRLFSVERLQFDDMTVDAPGPSADPFGTDNDDKLTWGGYGDVIFGHRGDDTLNGGAGDDTMDGGYDDDILNGGDGDDTAAYSTIQSAVHVSLAIAGPQDTGGAGTDQLSGFENLIGSAFDDVLTGDGGDNVLNGWAGNDSLDGGAGSDTVSYDGAALGVRVDLAQSVQDTRGAGTDTLVSIENLTGSAWNDVLTGDGGANLIRGGAGNDRLDGSVGDDTLVGGAGKDKLTGGDGFNTFRFEAGSDSLAAKPDQITDLKAGDVIDLSAMDADLTQDGDQAFALVSAFDGHAGELTLAYVAGKDRTLLRGDLDGDGKADFSIAVTGDHHDFAGLVL